MAKATKKEQDIQSIWLDRIRRAKKVRSDWRKLMKVDMAREYFDGKQNPDVSDEDWITINHVYSHLKAQLPALYAADPYFYIKLARSYNPAPQAIALYEFRGKMRQNMLNYLKRELKLKSKVRLAIQDAFFAYGVAKVHYTSDLKDNPDAGRPMFTEDGETMLMTDGGEPLMNPDQIPINGKYRVTRLHPDDFLWDEDAGPLEENGDWHWVAHRIRMTIEKAKLDPKYNKKALKMLENKGETKGDEEKSRERRKKGMDVSGRSETGGKKFTQKHKEPDLVVFWEIYDLDNGRWLTIAEEGEIPVMMPDELPPGVEDHPFSVLRFTLRDDSPYPITPISQGIDLSKEYNRARSDIQKHRKRFNRKYKATGPWDSGELSKLEAGDDGTIIVSESGGDIDAIKDAPLDPMRYSELAYIKAEMIETFGGSTDEARGIAGAESATQAGILDKRLEIKEGDQMSMVMDFTKEIARKLDQLVQANLDGETAVQITGPQGEFWEMVRPEDYNEIDGEFEYTVNVGSTLPQMPQMERASWQAFLQFLANAPQFILSKRLMKKAAEMHHIEDEMMLEELRQIAIQMMSGQIPMPGNQGSQAGVGEARPASAMGGQAGGVQSLMKGPAAIGG